MQINDVQRLAAGLIGSVSTASSRLQIIPAKTDVCRLLANNQSCLQNNVGRRGRMLSANLGRNRRCLQVGRRMFAGHYI